MRISSTEQFRQGIDSILDQQAKLNRTQQQLATGKKILSPSDDPCRGDADYKVVSVNCE